MPIFGPRIPIWSVPPQEGIEIPPDESSGESTGGPIEPPPGEGECRTRDVLREPVPCIPFPVGMCPEAEASESTGISVCSSGSDSPIESCIRGWRDRPRKWYGSDVPGFTIGSVVQYFWVPLDKDPVRQHSYHAFNWDATGFLKSIEMDDFKTPRRFLFDRDEAKRQKGMTCPPNAPVDFSSFTSGSSTLGSAPVDPASIVRDTDGCIARIFAVRGEYGCMNPDAGASASSGSSSNINRSEYSVPTIFPEEQFHCFQIDGGQLVDISIADTDPTLTDYISELAMEFDSDGRLLRVFWGGREQCEPNPCLWDQNKPPLDKDGKPRAGCVVPFMQQTDRVLEGESWDLWLIYFDSEGRYIWSCAYMRMCSCPVTCSHDFCESTSMPQPFCECRPVCLLTGGCQELAYFPAECPSTISLDCEEALISACVDDIGEPGTCDYTWNLGCCPAPFVQVDPDGLIISRASDYSGIHNGCLYTNYAIGCEILEETHRDEEGI